MWSRILTAILFMNMTGICYAMDGSIVVTPRLGLNVIPRPFQQMHIPINENSMITDSLIMAKAVSMFATDPIEIASDASIWSATNGDIFIIPDNAVGAWAAYDDYLAVMVNSGWRYIAPNGGMKVMVDYDLLPTVSSGTRLTYPIEVEYSSSTSSWNIPYYSRFQGQVVVGRDQIYDDLFGVDYFGYTGGGAYSSALFKGFAEGFGSVGMAILKSSTPSESYDPMFIVKNAQAPPVGGSGYVQYPYVASKDNVGFKFGWLGMHTNLSTSPPDVNSVSDVVGASTNVGFLWISNGSDGYTKGSLNFTDTSGTVHTIVDTTP